MAKIICPNQQYNGVSASVPFTDGVGHTDNPHLLAWFKSRGYTVEDEEAGGGASPFAGMSVEDLKAYAVTNGINIGNSTSINGIIKKIEDARKLKPPEGV